MKEFKEPIKIEIACGTDEVEQMCRDRGVAKTCVAIKCGKLDGASIKISFKSFEEFDKILDRMIYIANELKGHHENNSIEYIDVKLNEKVNDIRLD